MKKSENNDYNVDKSNMKLLENSSAEWWDPFGPAIFSHALNPSRIEFIRDALISTSVIKAEDKDKSDVFKGLNMLDVGCGAGVFSEALAKYQANVIGLDPSEELLKVAKDHLKGQSLNVKYIPEYIEQHSINNAEKYDVVIASEVIEHIPDQKAFLFELTKCVKPNGSIFVTTANRTIVSYFTIPLAEYVFKTLPINSHVWSHFMTPSEVEEILEEKNCKTIYVRGIWYTPYVNKTKLSWYEGFQYALHAVKHDTKKQN